MVVAPQFNYLYMMLPLKISYLIYKPYNRIISDFLWDKKKPRIKMSKMCTGRDKRDKGGHCLPDVRVYWIGSDLDLHWVTIEQSLAAPNCPITILSQQVENKDLIPALSYSRSVWRTIHKI